MMQISPIAFDSGWSAGTASGRSASLLTGVILAEVHATANELQYRGFLRAAGARLATLADMNGVDDLYSLTDRVNRLWNEYGWGHASFEMLADGVLIIHARLPALNIPGVAQHDALRSILCGAYDAWMRQLGSGPQLRTRVVAASDGELRLKHGL